MKCGQEFPLQGPPQSVLYLTIVRNQPSVDMKIFPPNCISNQIRYEIIIYSEHPDYSALPEITSHPCVCAERIYLIQNLIHTLNIHKEL